MNRTLQSIIEHTFIHPIFTLRCFNSFAIVMVISNRLPLMFLFKTYVVPRFKKSAVVGFHSHIFWRSSQLFVSLQPRVLDPLLVYEKLMFRINKQFGIDSILDWESHYWVCQIFTRFTHTLALSQHRTP